MRPERDVPSQCEISRFTQGERAYSVTDDDQVAAVIEVVEYPLSQIRTGGHGRRVADHPDDCALVTRMGDSLQAALD